MATVSGMDFANGATAIAVLTVCIVPLSTDFGWTRTQIAAVTSVGAVVGALIAPFAGRLVGRRGACLPLSGLHCRFSAWAYWALFAPEGVQRYTSLGPQ